MDTERGEFVANSPSLMPLTVLKLEDAYTTLCSVRADTSKLAGSMQPHHLPDGGGTYYSILFYVVLLFGLTELKAQISWIDNVCLCVDRHCWC